MTRHAYGWKRPLPGLTHPWADTGLLSLNTQVDPRRELPPVFDQGQLGSCTANATAACFQYDAIVDGHDCGELSRLWIYFWERSLEHTLDQGDCGAMGHDAFTVAQHGIPAETGWPYDIARFEQRPPDVEPRVYRLHKAVKSVPQTVTSIKQVLSNRQTVAFGFTVYESFEGEWQTPGVMPVPRRGEQVLGGHEVLIVGYLADRPEYALVRNSWGSGWGEGGYFFFPWKVLLSSNMASDFRTIARPL